MTTSAFSEVVRKQAAAVAAGPGQRTGSSLPIRLIDGQELLELLIRHRLGVRERGDWRAGSGGDGWKSTRPSSEDWLTGIADCPGPRKRSQVRKTRPLLVSATPQQNGLCSVPPGWRVTVQILPQFPQSSAARAARGTAELGS